MTSFQALDSLAADDLRRRVPAQELIECLVRADAEGQVRRLPLGIVRLSNDAMSWFRGARGELDVAARLRSLGPEWTVLHSVPIGKGASDIDHIAIGPHGVFTINSKRHVDKNVWVAGSTFKVNGHSQHHLRNSQHEAQRVSQMLATSGSTIIATPVIAVSGAKTLTVKDQPRWDGVPIHVVAASGIRRRLRRGRPALTTDLVAATVTLASNPRTWNASPRFESDPVDLRRLYVEIDRGIDRWNLAVLLGMLAFVGAAVGVGFLVLPMLVP